MIPDGKALEKAIDRWQKGQLGAKMPRTVEDAGKISKDVQRDAMFKWMKKVDPTGALQGLVQGVLVGVAVEVKRGTAPDVAFDSALLTMFILGWEMREEFDPTKKKGK